MKQSFDINFIREKISLLRTNASITERNLSLALGYNIDYISNITTGGKRPSLEAIINICDYFDISLFEFFYMEKQDLQTRELYNELRRLGNDNIDDIVMLLKSIDIKEFDSLKSILRKYTKLTK